jgi:hypothetical protein
MGSVFHSWCSACRTLRPQRLAWSEAAQSKRELICNACDAVRLAPEIPISLYGNQIMMGCQRCRELRAFQLKWSNNCARAQLLCNFCGAAHTRWYKHLALNMRSVLCGARLGGCEISQFVENVDCPECVALIARRPDELTKSDPNFLPNLWGVCSLPTEHLTAIALQEENLVVCRECPGLALTEMHYFYEGRVIACGLPSRCFGTTMNTAQVDCPDCHQMLIEELATSVAPDWRPDHPMPEDFYAG